MKSNELEISGKAYLAYFLGIWIVISSLLLLVLGAWAFMAWVIS